MEAYCVNLLFRTSGRFYLKINDGRIYLKYVSDLQHLMFAFKMLN